MWHEIKTQAEADAFLDRIGYFHDGCVKELAFVSGTWVDEELNMHFETRERGALRVAFQFQWRDTSMIEMLFTGLDLLKLPPVDENHMFDLTEAALLVQPDRVRWRDDGGVSGEDVSARDGMLICARRAFWRPVEGRMGEAPFYLPADGG